MPPQAAATNTPKTGAEKQEADRPRGAKLRLVECGDNRDGGGERPRAMSQVRRRIQKSVIGPQRK